MAYNMYAAAVESTNKTVAVFARKANDKEVDAKVNDNKFLNRKLKEPNEWKDHTRKNHRKHSLAFTACKSMSAILWKLLDYHVAMSDPNDAKKRSKEVRLSELLTHADLTDKLDDMSKRELLEYALNTVLEQSVVVYLTHHYSHEVVVAFTGNSPFLVDQSIPTQERIDARSGEEGPKNDPFSQSYDSTARGPREKEEGVVEEVAKGRIGLESNIRNTNNNCLAFRRDSEEVSPPERKREAL